MPSQNQILEALEEKIGKEQTNEEVIKIIANTYDLHRADVEVVALLFTMEREANNYVEDVYG